MMKKRRRMLSLSLALMLALSGISSDVRAEAMPVAAADGDASSQTQSIDLGKLDPTLLELRYLEPDTGSDGFIWTGLPIRPRFAISYNGITLTEETDFTITEYSNNTEVSTSSRQAQIVIEGIGTCSGTLSLPFTILPVDMTQTVNEETEDGSEITVVKHADSVTCKVTGPTYTGKDALRPDITITRSLSSGRQVTLTENQDYTVSCHDITESGGSYTITYQNHYTGTYTGVYTTSPIVLDEAARITLTHASLPYRGEAYDLQDFGISVAASGLVLTENVDYTLETDDNLIDAGSHIITLTATDEDSDPDTENVRFTGVYPIEVTITPVDLTDNTAVRFTYTDPETAVYNGKSQSLPLQKSADAEGVYDNIQLSYQVGEKTVGAFYGTDYKVLSYKNNVNAGTATAVIGGASDNFTGTREVTFSIAPFDLSEGGAIDDIADQEYTAAAVEPALSVHAAIGSGTVTLKAGVDYTTAYRDNTNVGSDTASVTVTGLGNYKGTLSKVFTITGNTSAFENAQVSVSPLTYNGAVLTPVITAAATLNGSSVTLVQNTDYTVEVFDEDGTSPKELKDVGDYTLKLTGKGNYSGSLTALVSVGKASLKGSNVTVDFSGADSTHESDSYYVYNGQVQMPAVTLSIDGHAIDSAQYKVSYKNNRQVGTATVIIRAVGGNLTGETTASFRIGNDIDGAAIAFTQQPSAGASTLSYPFTGGEIKPAITASIEGTALREGVDYVVVYENNINAGGAKVRIKGIGTYAGETQSQQGVLDFEITPLTSVDKNAVTFHDENGDVIHADYVGNYVAGIPFKVSEVQLNHVPLDAGNYILSYSGNDALGHVTVTLSWKGGNILVDNDDTIRLEFELRRLITDAVISAIPSRTYTGSEIKPDDFTVTLKYGNELLTLKKDEDYTISYQDNINAGDAVVRITGTKEKGVYAGEAEAEFEILPCMLSDAVIAPIPDQVYVDDSTELTPALTVTCAGRTLLAGTDYEADYEDNDAAGTATVTISAAGDNYDGECSASFTILPRSL